MEQYQAAIRHGESIYGPPPHLESDQAVQDKRFDSIDLDHDGVIERNEFNQSIMGKAWPNLRADPRQGGDPNGGEGETASLLPGGVRGAPGSYANLSFVSPTRVGEAGGPDGVQGAPTLERTGYTEGNRALLRSKSPGVDTGALRSQEPPEPLGDEAEYRSAQPGDVCRELEAKYSRKVNSALSKWKHR